MSRNRIRRVDSIWPIFSFHGYPIVSSYASTISADNREFIELFQIDRYGNGLAFLFFVMGAVVFRRLLLQDERGAMESIFIGFRDFPIKNSTTVIPIPRREAITSEFPRKDTGGIDSAKILAPSRI